MRKLTYMLLIIALLVSWILIFVDVVLALSQVFGSIASDTTWASIDRSYRLWGFYDN